MRKKNSILIALFALITAALFSSLKRDEDFCPKAPVYTVGGTFTGCYTAGSISCGRMAEPGDYYTCFGEKFNVALFTILKRD